MGSVPMPTCPPKLTLKLPETAMYSLISAEEILSISEPPYCSGMSTLAMPISHAFRISSRVTAKSLCSIFSVLGRISFFANSSVVRTICLCSSVRSSGVNTWSVVCSSIRKLPPTNLVLLGTATVAILFLLVNTYHGGTETRRKQGFSRESTRKEHELDKSRPQNPFSWFALRYRFSVLHSCSFAFIRGSNFVFLRASVSPWWIFHQSVQILNNPGRAHAAADAHGHQSISPVAALKF